MTGLLLHVALFPLGTTHDSAIGQAGPSILSNTRERRNGDGMETAFGWTQIARSDVAKAAELLKSGERGVRDEIGFLTLHQGFADRFFPGTSVLQTRLRYALFVPWQIQDLEDHPRIGGVPAEERLKRAERNLVIRLRGADHGVIGLRSERYEPAQPPSTIYWTALRLWGILN